MLSKPDRLPWNPPLKPIGHDWLMLQLIRPLDGDIMPPSSLISVDFPCPFRPNKANLPPFDKSKERF